MIIELLHSSKASGIEALLQFHEVFFGETPLLGILSI